MKQDILVYLEQRDGNIQRIGFELISGARVIARQLGGRVVAFMPGFQITKCANQLKGKGADEILLVDHPILADYLTEPYAQSLIEAIHHVKPSIVLIGSTANGMDLAPRVAARVGAGLVTDCTGLSIHPDSGYLLMERPGVDGIQTNLYCCEEGLLQMATVRPGVLKFIPNTGLQEKSSEPIHILDMDLSQHPQSVRVLSTSILQNQSEDITQAKVLAAGGRGAGGPEGFAALRTIAGLLGGTIACSRACVEAGWVDASFQVGQTGKTVRPDLYLACGISGAFQHVTGMEGSNLIISINKNPAAPIFDISDLGIVGTAEILLPKLIEAIKDYQASV